MRLLGRNRGSYLAIALSATALAYANAAVPAELARTLQSNSTNNDNQYVVQFTDSESANKALDNANVDVLKRFNNGFYGATIQADNSGLKSLVECDCVVSFSKDTEVHLVGTIKNPKVEDNLSEISTKDQSQVVSDGSSDKSSSINNRMLSTAVDAHASLSQFSTSVVNVVEGKMRELFGKGALRTERSLQFDNGDLDTQVQEVNSNQWNLDSIDDETRKYDYLYAYEETGKNVAIYVVATGIKTDHNDFNGRASNGVNLSNDQDNNDCSGVGTAIASLAVGQYAGVAKDSEVVSVKIFPTCDESNNNSNDTSASTVIEALDWIRGQQSSTQRSVVILALTGDFNPVLNAAISSASEAGIIVVVAAGDEETNDCESSPQSAPRALTVSAFSGNWTAADSVPTDVCVDIFAPGFEVLAAWISSSDSAAFVSGTGFAAAHVAGVVARWLQENPKANDQETSAAVLCSGQTYQLWGLDQETHNVRLYMHPVGLTDPTEPYSGCPAGREIVCPGGVDICNARGECALNGECNCDCGYIGHDCSNRIIITDLTGKESGSESGNTANSTSYFGFESGEAYYTLSIPAGTDRVELTTCSGATDFDTVLWVFNECFDNELSINSLVAFNDDSQDGQCSRIVLTDIKCEQTYYILVEGFKDAEGSFELNFSVDAGILPQPSAGPTTRPPIEPRPEVNVNQPNQPDQSTPSDTGGGDNGALSVAVAAPLTALFAMVIASMRQFHF